MRFILSIAAAASLALATPAFAKDSGDAAFALLSKYMPDTKQSDYIKLQSSIKMSDAMAFDAQLSEVYGAPATTREGLKVWEVENTRGGAKKTTIMCGPDGQGGIYISADRRGPSKRSAASRQVQPTSRTRTNFAKPKRDRSQERD